MTTCSWCEKPSELAYHEQCWGAYQESRTRGAAKRNQQAHAIIKQIREGGSPVIPPDLVLEYGQYFTAAKESRKRGRGGRSTEGV